MIPLSLCIAVSSEMSIKYLREVFAKKILILVTEKQGSELTNPLTLPKFLPNPYLTDFQHMILMISIA